MNPMQMMNNPIMQLFNVVKGGGNPMQLLNMMGMKNPQVAQAMNMMRGKNVNELREMANNMAKERGTNIETIAQQFGVQIPK